MGKGAIFGGKPASKTDRVASYLDRSPMKRDRGYETSPNNVSKRVRGTESPVK